MKVDSLIQKIKSETEKYDVILLHLDAFFNREFSHLCMGILYLATVLKEKGYLVKCLGVHELAYMTESKIRRLFKSSGCRIAGFYTLSDNIFQVEEMAAKIKSWNPDILTVTGGPYATSMGKKILDYPHYDVCVVGEGEEPIIALANLKIKGKGSLEEIPGIIYRKDGKIFVNPPSIPIQDLDQLPFPDHTLLVNEKNFHIVSGRGCPYKCIFCFQGVHGLKYRYRSAKSVADEIIENVEKLNANTFDIIDDTFITNPARVAEIASRLEEYKKKTGRRFIFFCQGRVDVMDRHPEMLEQLKRAGLARVQVGLESGCPELLKAYDKNITVDQIRNVVGQVARLGGMCIVGTFIVGGPGETEDTLNQTLEFAKELIHIAPGMVEVNAAFLGPYPGTKIAENPEKYGLKIIDKDFKKGLSLLDVHMVSDTLDAVTLRNFKDKFFYETGLQMEKEIARMPWEMILYHFNWAEEFSIQSKWYLNFLSKRKALRDYIEYLKSERFKTLPFIPPGELPEWHPIRMQDVKQFSHDCKKILLPETIGRYELTDPDEILIYELCTGKLTIGRMIDEFLTETGKDISAHEAMVNYFIPFFKKLEKTFHVIFYK